MAKRIKYLIISILVVFFVSEMIHQYSIRSKYYKNGNYLWEQYVVERNLKNIEIIKNFFDKNINKVFTYEVNPNSGSLDSLPANIRSSIARIKSDVLSGVLSDDNSTFSFSFARQNNIYSIHIYAGADFVDNYNGYNLSMIITNGKNPSNSYIKYSRFGSSQIYYDSQTNARYRSKAFLIFRYNYNNPDLLIYKLFR